MGPKRGTVTSCVSPFSEKSGSDRALEIQGEEAVSPSLALD